MTQVVTNGRVEDLFVALWEGNHEPGCVRFDKGAVDSFTVRIGNDGKQVVRVSPSIDSATTRFSVRLSPRARRSSSRNTSHHGGALHSNPSMVSA